MMIILMMMHMNSCSFIYFYVGKCSTNDFSCHCFYTNLHLMSFILITKSSNNIFNVFSLNVYIFIAKVMTQTMHMLLTHQPAYQAPSLKLISQLKHHTHLINTQHQNKPPFSLQCHSFLDFIAHTRNKNCMLMYVVKISL